MPQRGVEPKANVCGNMLQASQSLKFEKTEPAGHSRHNATETCAAQGSAAGAKSQREVCGCGTAMEGALDSKNSSSGEMIRKHRDHLGIR